LVVPAFDGRRTIGKKQENGKKKKKKNAINSNAESSCDVPQTGLFLGIDREAQWLGGGDVTGSGVVCAQKAEGGIPGGANSGE
jgi:hypothetical protein